MRFADFLATYALDRVTFGDSTKYLYEGVYEVFEGNKIDFTLVDDLAIKVFDPDLIEESGIITEEIKERIDNGELQEVLKESNLVNKIGGFLSGKSKVELAKEINALRTSDVFRTIPDNYKEKWLTTLAQEKNPGGIWTKLSKTFGNYQSGNVSSKFAAKSAEAAKAAATDPTNALASMKAILSKGMAWVLNPAHFNVVFGTIGGILALKLILRVLKKRKIKMQQRKQAEQQLAQMTQLSQIRNGRGNMQVEEVEEIDEELLNNFDKSMKIVENLINTNKQVNRVEYGITLRNSPVINY